MQFLSHHNDHFIFVCFISVELYFKSMLENLTVCSQMNLFSLLKKFNYILYIIFINNLFFPQEGTALSKYLNIDEEIRIH